MAAIVAGHLTAKMLLSNCRLPNRNKSRGVMLIENYTDRRGTKMRNTPRQLLRHKYSDAILTGSSGECTRHAQPLAQRLCRRMTTKRLYGALCVNRGQDEAVCDLKRSKPVVCLKHREHEWGSVAYKAAR